MKLTVFLLLACLSVCYVNSANPRVQLWGQITSRTLRTKNVVIPAAQWQSKNYTLYYPELSLIYPIYGIQQFDFAVSPSTVKFLKGGIGHRNVTLFIESQRGQPINSTFIFYA